MNDHRKYHRTGEMLTLYQYRSVNLTSAMYTGEENHGWYTMEHPAECSVTNNSQHRLRKGRLCLTSLLGACSFLKRCMKSYMEIAQCRCGRPMGYTWILQKQLTRFSHKINDGGKIQRWKRED